MTESGKVASSSQDPDWWAEVVYRFAFNAEHRPLPPDAAAARLRLETGNRSFAELLGQTNLSPPATLRIDVAPYDVGLFPGLGTVPRQQPFAAIVGCADARVPVELVFSEGPNDLFVVRVAGNGLGDDVLGSLNYALDHLKESLRTIVVLGHSQCGAVTAAVDVHLQPGKYLGVMTQKDLRHILDRTLVVIQVGARWLQRAHGAEIVNRPGYRTALVELAITLNAALTAHGIHRGLDVAERGGVEVLYGVYLLEERLVWSPRRGERDWFRLAPAPGNLDEFGELCDLLVECPRLLALLGA
ncbi:MAG: carbonic anhydrase [Beijerinckiaceae bacterium]